MAKLNSKLATHLCQTLHISCSTTQAQALQELQADEDKML